MLPVYLYYRVTSAKVGDCICRYNPSTAFSDLGGGAYGNCAVGWKFGAAMGILGTYVAGSLSISALPAVVSACIICCLSAAAAQSQQSPGSNGTPTAVPVAAAAAAAPSSAGSAPAAGAQLFSSAQTLADSGHSHSHSHHAAASVSANAPIADLFPGVGIGMGGAFHKVPFSDRLSCDGVFQDYCSKPGIFYPRSDISMFIDENKALMRRMFGSVSSRSLIRKEEEDQPNGPNGQLDNSDLRRKRMVKNGAAAGAGTGAGGPQPALTSYLCPVEEELVTPFWAVNGTGVKLAIVNSPPFEQAVHTVKCARSMTSSGLPLTPAQQGTAGGSAGTMHNRCHPSRPCWCSQEYSWFRLLAYDPHDNCKGIFMDWFKFPSHCACKCMLADPASSG
ncbi:protein spaetzle 4-like [Paramacrobiotus metropolitanus]|uniref:protein spaetzle 4-like n=1 Tax=Paramacrobiotus metropolitanus TaxID=2943436 RepID=UPI0024458F7B|nr:protein spaetzle 4-like [Paramacrobiotus metropolitanus]